MVKGAIGQGGARTRRSIAINRPCPSAAFC